MSSLSIVGGVYREHCDWPNWNQVYGSGGRAASAIPAFVDEITLYTYANDKTKKIFTPVAEMDNIRLELTKTEHMIRFDYIHTLSVPFITPAPAIICASPPIEVKAQAVLRFGMLEGSGKVIAGRCVYDPQSAFSPERFEKNGSQAETLAIVGNRKEIVALAGGGNDPLEAARSLLNSSSSVVVVKEGVGGAKVVEKTGITSVPAFQSRSTFTIGSGDVFAAIFAAEWASKNSDAVEAARIASRAVAEFVETMALPIPPRVDMAELPEATVFHGLVYLAGPFFSLGQRWLVDEARRCLLELGLSVFSPIHDIGTGPAERVGPADLEALDKCDRVFALLDGMDSGTLFEVGWARKAKKPVYGLAQSATEEELKMVVGSGCRVFDDFVTAIYHTAWLT